MNQTMNRNRMNQDQKDARLQLFILVLAILALMMNLTVGNILGLLVNITLIIISAKRLNLTV